MLLHQDPKQMFRFYRKGHMEEFLVFHKKKKKKLPRVLYTDAYKKTIYVITPSCFNLKIFFFFLSDKVK